MPMLADRYLRWCVFGYGMGLARFTALKTKVDQVRKMVVMYEGLVESLKDIQDILAKGHEGYDWKKQAEVAELLYDADYCLRHLCARENL